jgi:Leucine-rich repeat (LRR) protein
MGLPELEYLYLKGNKLSGNIPANFGGSTTLKDIHLEDNLLSGEIPEVSNGVLLDISK